MARNATRAFTSGVLPSYQSALSVANSELSAWGSLGDARRVLENEESAEEEFKLL